MGLTGKLFPHFVGYSQSKTSFHVTLWQKKRKW